MILEHVPSQRLWRTDRRMGRMGWDGRDGQTCVCVMYELGC